MTRILVGHSPRDRTKPLSAQADCHQELGDIPHLVRKDVRSLTPCRVSTKQLAVLLQGGAAASRVDNHEINARLLKHLDVVSGQLARPVPLTTMHVKRPAALLRRRN